MIKTEMTKSNPKFFIADLKKELLERNYEGFLRNAGHTNYAGMKEILANTIEQKLLVKFNEAKAKNTSKAIVTKLEEDGTLNTLISTQYVTVDHCLINWMPRKQFRKTILNLIEQHKEIGKKLTAKGVETVIFDINKSLYEGIAGLKGLPKFELDDNAFDDCRVWLNEMVAEKLIEVE